MKETSEEDGGYLFIGGHHDGRRIAIPVTQERVTLSGSTPAHREIYDSHRMYGNMNIHKVFVIQDMSADEVLQRLLSAYRIPEEQP